MYIDSAVPTTAKATSDSTPRPSASRVPRRILR